MAGSTGDNLETEPEAVSHGGPGISIGENPGLVVLWSSEGPAHVGTWLPIPFTEKAKPRILGRGVAQAGDEHQRVELVRQRPGSSEHVPAFENRSLSRVQLLVQHVDSMTLHVKNVGRCRLSVNGTDVSESELRPGDVVELGSQLVLVCATRPSRLMGPPPTREHGFGHADAHGFVGESAPAWGLRAQIAAAAPRGGHVLVLGATGTGKEIVAGALHALSKKSGPFVSRNAATLPESLVNAELFGNLKDYPNPGMPDRKGLVGAADGGTLFLDEFAELPQPAQASLLRALDHGEYQRLGETNVRRSHFRLIAATNRPESALRSDLFARFDFRVKVPNLAERREDIPFILHHLFTTISKEDPELCARFAIDGQPNLSSRFVIRLARHEFERNVRELRSLLWEALHQGESGRLEWPGDVRPSAPPAVSSSAGPEVSEIRRVLASHDGSIEKSWRELGLSSRYALQRLLKKHGIVLKKELKRG